MTWEHVAVTSRDCGMGVGCGETGICYALAQGQPEQCPNYEPPEDADEPEDEE